MILYQLKCSDGHAFEAWFKDSGTYEVQARDGEIACPYCGDQHISKAPMAPSVVKSRGDRGEASLDNPDPSTATGNQAGTISGAKTEAILPDRSLGGIAKQASEYAGEARAEEVARQILRAIKKVQRHIEDTFDDVGDKFAEEARAIHHGDAKERGIYGQATETEAAELAEEGIEFQRFAWPASPSKKTN